MKNWNLMLQKVIAWVVAFTIMVPSTAVFAADPEYNVIRIEGKDRYQTAARVAERVRPASSRYLLASGENYPDALAGAPLTKGMYPILLTGKDRLHPETRAVLAKNSGAIVTILGGKNTITESVEAELRAMGVAVERIAGQDRYDTASQIADEIDTKQFVIASGTGFADALAGSALALHKGAAILLGNSVEVPAQTMSHVMRVDDAKLTLLGGNHTFPASITAEYRALDADFVRYTGRDRYETSTNIAQSFTNPQSVIVATGENYPDALTAAALAGKLKAPILLVKKDAVPKSVREYLTKHKNSIQDVYILGGENSVSKQIASVLANPEQPATAAWQKEYAKLLRGEIVLFRSNQGPSKLSEANSQFAVFDFDGDGIQELIIKYRYNEGTAELTDYYIASFDGNLINTFEYQDRTFFGRVLFGYHAENRQLLVASGHEAIHHSGYALYGGQMHHVYYLRSGYMDASPEERIGDNKVDLTEAEYVIKAKAYMDALRTFDFVDNTSENRESLLFTVE